MSKDTVRDLRRRIDAAKGSLARVEGEANTLTVEIEKTVKELRKTLKCQAGEEKDAMIKLRRSIDADEVKLSRLLDTAEKAGLEE